MLSWISNRLCSTSPVFPLSWLVDALTSSGSGLLSGSPMIHLRSKFRMGIGFLVLVPFCSALDQVHGSSYPDLFQGSSLIVPTYLPFP